MSSSYVKPNMKSLYYDKTLSQLPSLKGKTVAITGTTSGTGYVAARAIAHKGGRVVLLNRASNKEKKSFELLTKDFGPENFVRIECDLQSFASVRSAAKQLELLCPEGLDVLCNNAGIMAMQDKATVDGFDIQMQTNHLSHFLLTKELMPCLERAAESRGEARVVNHSSIARFMVSQLDPKYLEKRGGKLGGDGTRMMLFPQGRWLRYAQTKLANAAFTACLYEKLNERESKVKALIAHPGLSSTDLQVTALNDIGSGGWFMTQMMKMSQSQEDGALGIIVCIADPAVQSGDFIGPGAGKMAVKGPVTIFSLEPFYDNRETKDILWNKSCEAIGDKFDL